MSEKRYEWRRVAVRDEPPAHLAQALRGVEEGWKRLERAMEDQRRSQERLADLEARRTAALLRLTGRADAAALVEFDRATARQVAAAGTVREREATASARIVERGDLARRLETARQDRLERAGVERRVQELRAEGRDFEADLTLARGRTAAQAGRLGPDDAAAREQVLAAGAAQERALVAGRDRTVEQSAWRLHAGSAAATASAADMPRLATAALGIGRIQSQLVEAQTAARALSAPALATLARQTARLQASALGQELVGVRAGATAAELDPARQIAGDPRRINPQTEETNRVLKLIAEYLKQLVDRPSERTFP